MSARFAALVCLLYVSVVPVRAQFLGTGEVAVYLKGDMDRSAPALSEMKAELSSLMKSVGVDIHWWDPTENTTSARQLVVLQLQGSCFAPKPGDGVIPLKDQISLGSSFISDGKILPFSRVDCAALTRFIGRSIAEYPGAQRDYTYGRAMARLAAHEFYHVLSRRSEHARTGIAKAEFATSDLLGDHLEFEHATFAGIRRDRASEEIAPGIVVDVGAEK